MQSRITKELALDALLMAVWRRAPKSLVTVHSDQGSQYTSHEWQSFLADNGLKPSMSRRGGNPPANQQESKVEFSRKLSREILHEKIEIQ